MHVGRSTVWRTPEAERGRVLAAVSGVSRTGSGRSRLGWPARPAAGRSPGSCWRGSSSPCCAGRCAASNRDARRRRTVRARGSACRRGRPRASTVAPPWRGRGGGGAGTPPGRTSADGPTTASTSPASSLSCSTGKWSAQEVPEQGDPGRPQHRPAPGEEPPAVHPADAGDHGDERAHNRTRPITRALSPCWSKKVLVWSKERFLRELGRPCSERGAPQPMTFCEERRRRAPTQATPMLTWTCPVETQQPTARQRVARQDGGKQPALDEDLSGR